MTAGRRVYLDWAATAPMRESALRAWVAAARALQRDPGNPSALHAGGRAARQMLEDARERVARVLGAERAEVVFTSGATESDALGVAGAARSVRRAHPARRRIVASSVEHDAVAGQRPLLQAEGFAWSRLPVDAEGRTVLDGRARALLADAAVVSCSLVCSETGVIQPVADLARMARESGDRRERPLVHADAAQALTCLDVNFHRLGVDLMSVGGHKVGGPVGTGALVVARGTSLVSDRPGGGQEGRVRSGTNDVAGACALAAALEDAAAHRAERHARYGALVDRLLAGLPRGARATTRAATAPSIVHLSLDTAHPEAVLLAMDHAGVLVSAGSACHAGVTRPSGVLLAMGRSEAQALGVLRVSFGPESRAADVDAFLAALPDALAAARSLDRFEAREEGAVA